MDSTPSRTGLLVTAVGAVAAAISVFLPWYAISFTQAAADQATQSAQAAFAQFGGRLPSQFNTAVNAAVGHSVVTVSAHQVLSTINVVVLVVAAVAGLLALAGLAQSSPLLPGGSAGALGLLGLFGGALVLFRIISPPAIGSGLVNFSVQPAAWVCLLGCAGIALGGRWPRGAASGDADAAWSQLSGWTPGD